MYMKVYMAFFTVGMLGITGGLINASKVSSRESGIARRIGGEIRSDAMDGWDRLGEGPAGWAEGNINQHKKTLPWSCGCCRTRNLELCSLRHALAFSR